MPSNPKALEVSQRGIDLLRNPLLNKGTAFPESERTDFGLHALLPPHVSTMEEQFQRVRENFDRLETPLKKYIQLRALQDRNETLFYGNYSGCVSVARGMNGWPRSAFSMAKTTL